MMCFLLIFKKVFLGSERVQAEAYKVENLKMAKIKRNKRRIITKLKRLKRLKRPSGLKG